MAAGVNLERERERAGYGESEDHYKYNLYLIDSSKKYVWEREKEIREQGNISEDHYKCIGSIYCSTYKHVY